MQPFAICNHSFKKRIELRTQTQPLIAEQRGGTDRVRNGPSRTRRTDEVPFIVGCSHFTRKNTRFRSAVSSPKQSPCNIHAAITMRSATTASSNAENHAHRHTTTHCRTQRRNRLRPERPQPPPPHRRGTFHRRLQPLYTEKHRRFRAPVSSPKYSPSIIHVAICNHSFKKRREPRTQTQPLIAEQRGGTDRVRNGPSRTRRTDEVPFIVGCSHFTRKNTRFRAPVSSPKQSPCNIHAAITLRSATTASRNA